MMAQAAAITTVRIMVLVPPESSFTSGRIVQSQLAEKLTVSAMAIVRLRLAGGIMIARNIP